MTDPANAASREAREETQHWPHGPWLQPDGQYDGYCRCGSHFWGRSTQDAEARWIEHYRTALADEAASQPREDTVEFVREWMLSGDYPVDPWTLEFAAAIDARTAPTDQAQGGGEVERLTKALADLDGKDWSESQRVRHILAALAQSNPTDGGMAL